MNLQRYDVIDGDLLDRAWDLYERAFDDLRAAAVQRHLMTRAEFRDVAADPRVTKLVTYDGSALTSVATMTRDLTSMPLISPEYFAKRWPALYAERRVFYIGFVAVDPDYHGTGVFWHLVESMSREVGAAGGVAVLDVCSRNSAVFKLPAAVERIAQSVNSEVSRQRLDEQVYWAYEFPPVPAQRTRPARARVRR